MEEIYDKQLKKRSEVEIKIAELKEKIEEYKEKSARTGSYKCLYCNKLYPNREGLNSHVKRRHQAILDEIKQTNEMFKEENPIYKIKKLEEERKRMQEYTLLK